MPFLSRLMCVCVCVSLSFVVFFVVVAFAQSSVTEVAFWILMVPLILLIFDLDFAVCALSHEHRNGVLWVRLCVDCFHRLCPLDRGGSDEHVLAELWLHLWQLDAQDVGELCVHLCDTSV